MSNGWVFILLTSGISYDTNVFNSAPVREKPKTLFILWVSEMYVTWEREREREREREVVVVVVVVEVVV